VPRGGALLSERQLQLMACSALVTLVFELLLGHSLEVRGVQHRQGAC
jgi:hypothetical protein